MGLSRSASSMALAASRLIVEDDVGLARQHTAHGLTDHGLVVDQQDRDLVLGQESVRCSSTRLPAGLR